MSEETDRLLRLELQIGRVVSDAESEKDTRKRNNDAVQLQFEKVGDRIVRLEKTIWVSMGGCAVILFIFEVAFRR